MKRKSAILILAVLQVLSCNPVQRTQEEQQPLLRIEPVITRATDVDFEQGDRLGVSVWRESGEYASNVPLVCSGGIFSGDLYWYQESGDEARILAYYPYQESGVPQTFRVSTDQTGGIASSDLIAASKSGILPTANAVTLVFRHQLTKLSIAICNQTGAPIAGVTLGGSVPEAQVDLEAGTVLAAGGKTEDIAACNVSPDTLWKAIVVPQTVAFDFSVKLSSGKVLTQKLKELELQPGTQYAISAVVYGDRMNIVTSGAIQDWIEGGDIPGGSDPEPEPEPEPEYVEGGDCFTYDGVTYPTVVLKDGKRWMAQNYRFIPRGLKPSASMGDLTAGIYYPLKANATALEFCTEAEVIAAQGYLYSVEVALGLGVDAIKDEEQARSLEGVRGICPPGWHIPTVDDYMNLVGKGAQLDTRADAPYYDASLGNCLLSLLNADGFNMHACGMVAIQYGSDDVLAMQLSGYLNSNPGAISSGFILGSSYKTSTTHGDDFIPYYHAIMPFESNGTCNVSGLKASNCTPVRCVAD